MNHLSIGFKRLVTEIFKVCNKYKQQSEKQKLLIILHKKEITKPITAVKLLLTFKLD